MACVFLCEKMDAMFEIIKIINNNTMLVNKDNDDYILLGKGIGFNFKSQKYLEDIPRDVKIFTPKKTNPNKNYKELLDEIDEKVLEASSEIVILAEETLGKLDPSLFLVLCGHLDFAIKRMKQNIVIEHPLIFEIEVLYAKEFSVALQAIKILENKLNMKISGDEAGYIALHLNGARSIGDIKKALRKTNILKLLVDELERDLKIKITKDIVYLGFVDYLRVMFYRLEHGIKLKNPLISNIAYSYKDYYLVSKKLAQIIQYNTKYILSEDEIAFMAINIYQSIESSK